MSNLDCRQARSLIDAAIDGEIDRAAFDAHVSGCGTCRAEFESRHAMADRLKAGMERFTPPPSFKAKLLAALPPEIPARRKHTGWLTGGAWTGSAVALAASLVLFLAKPTQQDALTKELVAAHVRSLMANHLTDVVSSDRHTVKPWFNGRVDLSPPVPDLTEQGYPLIGGRLDYLDDRSVAALVYGRRQHLINLFIWPEPGLPDRAVSPAGRNGYHVLQWRQSGVAYAIVSDVNAQDLNDFRQFWVAQAAQ